MRTQILEAQAEFHERPFATPLPLRDGFITDITEARAMVRVQVESREAIGRGVIYLSDLWAWPDPELTHAHRDAAMRGICDQIASDLPALCGGEPEHPLEMGLRLHHAMVTAELEIPMLARAVCASPFDAAIHDAAGQALGRSAFDFYFEPRPIPSADPLFADSDACGAIWRTMRRPVQALDAWLIVGPTMPLDEIRPWIQDRGYRCFKLRIPTETGPDVARTIEIFDAARELGAERPRLSVDSNEMHADSAAVLDYLERLRAASPAAFAALEYLEQPTNRDLAANPNDWRGVARLKPVIVDEGLISPDSFLVASEQGWSGFALKTCKGHSFSLVAAAWARENGLSLTMQDLTNPGLAAIHSALFAARIPALNGIELNSPQFTPAANADWLPRLAALLEPEDGMHRLPSGNPPGLGSTL